MSIFRQITGLERKGNVLCFLPTNIIFMQCVQLEPKRDTPIANYYTNLSQSLDVTVYRALSAL